MQGGGRGGIQLGCEAAHSNGRRSVCRWDGGGEGPQLRARHSDMIGLVYADIGRTQSGPAHCSTRSAAAGRHSQEHCGERSLRSELARDLLPAEHPVGAKWMEVERAGGYLWPRSISHERGALPCPGCSPRPGSRSPCPGCSLDRGGAGRRGSSSLLPAAAVAAALRQPALLAAWLRPS